MLGIDISMQKCKFISCEVKSVEHLLSHIKSRCVMRSICLFINSIRGGGAEHVCVTIANGFSERGWNVKLLTLNLDGKVQFM